MFSNLHIKYVQNSSIFLRRAGENKFAKFVDDNIAALSSAVISPDSDYSSYTIPTNLIPKELKLLINGVSIVKWEHFQPDNLPIILTSFFRLVADKVLHVPFRFADETVGDWYSKAISNWNTNRNESIRHLGRSLHLVQDVCIPMHTSIPGSIGDIIGILTKTQPNHNKFEMYCESNYVLSNETYKMVKLNVPQVIKDVAVESRKYMHLCDGVNMPELLRKLFGSPRVILTKMVYDKVNKLIEDDYKKAANFVNNYAQKYTTLFIYDFLKRVGY